MASTRSRRRGARYGLSLLALSTLASLTLVIAYWAREGSPSGHDPEDLPASLVAAPITDDRDESDVARDMRGGPVPTDSREAIREALQEVSTAGEEMRTTSFVVPCDVPLVASDLLTSYEQSEPCLLGSSGYMDLQGRVWACAVEGPGWVDLCVVRSDVPGGGSSVRLVRLRPPERMAFDG